MHSRAIESKFHSNRTAVTFLSPLAVGAAAACWAGAVRAVARPEDQTGARQVWRASIVEQVPSSSCRGS